MEKIIWIFSRLVKTCCACFLGTPLCVLEIQNLGLAQLRSHDVIALSVETRDLSWHLLQQNSSLRGWNWNWKAVPLGGNWAWQMGPTWRFPGGGGNCQSHQVCWWSVFFPGKTPALPMTWVDVLNQICSGHWGCVQNVAPQLRVCLPGRTDH